MNDIAYAWGRKHRNLSIDAATRWALWAQARYDDGYNYSMAELFDDYKEEAWKL